MNALNLVNASYLAEQLNPAGSIHEVEEDELPEIAPSHHAPSKARVFTDLLSSLE
jgi:hypothetical protein